jgi:hypothetical protein
LSTTTEASSSSNHFGGTTPFKVQVNFDIPTFEGQIDVDALEKWLNLLEGYFSVHNFSNRENITFVLLKVVPHVKHWWETYCEKKSTEESGIFGVEPTWDSFMDAIKEQYYPVGNYDDQYMRWTTLVRRGTKQCQSSQIPSIPCTPRWVSETLSEHLVLKYHGALHRYIQTEMEFLDISSLGATYRYVVKIEKKFKQRNKWEFGSVNASSTRSWEKESPTHKKRTKKGWKTIGQPV